VSVEHVWAGALTDTSVQVRARVTGASTRLAVSLQSDLSSPVYFGPVVPTADDMVTLDATGLTADTRYYYAIEDDSVLDMAFAGTFVTHPGPIGEIASYTIGAAGDAGLTGSAGDDSYITSQVSNNPVFDTMRAQALSQNWRWFSHLGDLHYRNIATADASLYRAAFNDNFTFNGTLGASARQGQFFRNVASTYVWDDHDFGPNNSDRTSAGNATANAVYRERVPSYALPSNGIYQSWQCGRVLYVQVDCRTFRDPNADPNEPGKTMLGTGQKVWLESLLEANAGGAEAMVFISSSRWIGGDDTWSSFLYERDEVVQLLGDTGWLERMVLVTADEHSLSFGSGPYNAYGRFPMFMFASMDSNYGTASREIYDIGNLPGRQQYGTIDVVDSGHTIRLKGTGWVNGVEWMNYSKYVDVGNPVFQVNYQTGQIYPPFEPVSDDQNLVNDVTASRVQGSTVRYERTDGALSVSEPPVGVGRYDESVTLNVASDEQLPGQAGWRVHLGTADAYRYPSTTVKLHGSPELLDEYVGLALGDKLEVLNPPAWLPPGDIQMITEGVQENFGWFHWDVSFNSSPGEPWTVGQLPLPADLSIADGTFETGVTGWTGTSCTFEQSTEQVYRGTYSGKITTTGTPTQAFVRPATANQVPVIPGETYRCSFWAYSPSGYATLSAAIDWRDSGGAYLSTDSETEAISAGAWTPRVVTATAPAGAAFAVYGPTLGGNPPTGTVLYVDDVQLRGTSVTADEAGTDQPNRAATSGSELYTAVDTDDTTLTVLTPQDGIYDRAPWIISEGLSDSPNLLPTHFPLDVALNGEIMEVSGISPFTYDSFARVEAAGSWGTADSGKAWTLDGGTTTERSVDGTYGLVNLSSSPSSIRFQLQPGSVGDCEIRAILSADQVATGESMIPGILFRYQDGSNYYRARLHFGTSGNMFTSVTRASTALASGLSLPFTYTANAEFHMRVRITGHRVLIRVWPVDSVEPDVWHNDQTITDTPIDSGQIGTTVSTFAGNTNVSPTIRVRDYQVENVQEMTVTRSINGVVRSHAAATGVQLARTTIVAL
jgi:hypothetical protein